MEKYDKGVLTYGKGRLLAYLVWYGKIRCVPSVPASVMRAIGYKSPGHWSKDVEDLMSEGFITAEKGYYKPTDKARRLLEPLIGLKRLALLNLVAAGVIFFVGFIIYELCGQAPLYIWNALIAAYLAIAHIHCVMPLHLLFRKAPKEEF
ncbi:MAG: hypothetical protein RMJ15_03445 [Nitrososphaerota archaeon]|nr:hypothetical protein [Nitrososphaerota archaeon]